MYRFSNRLQYKIPTVFIGSFLLLLVAMFAVFSTIGKNLLEEHAYKEVILSGNNIVLELGQRIALAESLATAIANLGEKLPRDEAQTRLLVEHVMNYEGTETFIAGGGLWPEPFRFDPAVERRSFFWGRDGGGVLRYFDDYNAADGPGYHNEEWYVPARYLRPGEVFWSKSYMDPYSYQPMVTVTVPMFRDQKFSGVSTIDLKLEGLHAFLEHSSKSFGGYAFAVDRNGKFLSFPDESLTKLYGTDAQGGRTEEFIDVVALAKKRQQFQPLAALVREAIDRVVSDAAVLPDYDAGLAAKIERSSYQIDEKEGQLIASILAVMHNRDVQRVTEPHQVFIDNDMLLGEAAFAAIFDMPDTSWKIVTVMPYSKAVAGSDLIYWNLVSVTVLVMLVSLVIMLLVVRRTLVRPIADMSWQLRLLAEAPESENKLLETSDSGELGELAYWFNRRSQQLFEVQSELRAAREGLERRVAERTEKLETEMERRRQEQLAREERVARAEKQHLAIVDLSLRSSSFQGDVVLAARIMNETAARTIGLARASIWLADETETVLRTVDLYEADSDEHSFDAALMVKDYPAYFAALRNDRSMAVADMFSDERTRDLREYATACGVFALLDSPIRVSGKLRGVVCFEHAGAVRQWTEDEIRFSGELADQFLQVLGDADRARSETQIRRLAFYDPLTELANRRLLQETMRHEIEVAKRHGVFGALLYLDLDNFKTLNDSLGHHIGDELLVQLSARLRDALRKEDIPARLGGDEFVVLITGESRSRQQAAESALNVARKIQAAISAPYRLHGYEHVITSSMGITLYPEDNATAADVLKQADTAMYRAKEDGRNTVCFYSPEMQADADNRLLLEKELRTAIAERQFEIWFQPQVDCQGVLVSAEALVRWMHPEKGLVAPAEFIPIAEETGLILELGAWILRDVCEFSKDCQISQVAVNISPMEFRQPDFVSRVTRTLQATGAEPGKLMIELTEGIVIENIADTISKMSALKKMGIRFSIDDFGTGYSSLAYLKRLPLDQLKINNEFVHDINIDPNDAVIVDTIISMARHLGLDVVAEGVETRQQLEFLADKGCHILQGYYFSAPLNKQAFREYLGTAVGTSAGGDVPTTSDDRLAR